MPSESVWDYPRPPRLERESRRITVAFAGEVICDTTSAWRILETSHPPTYYLPRADFAPGSLDLSEGSSFCEWKGWARYLDVGGEEAQPQPGGFYGGWVTSWLTGPFKGGPGAHRW